MQIVKINDVLKYEQPTKYIVETQNYNNNFKTPVLTAGKSFILGYTNEENGVFNNVPVIIFDDFTTAFHYVDFPFKVKSSAMKILNIVKEKADLKYLFYKMQTITIDKDLHKRYWISKYSQIQIPLPPLTTQQKIANILDKVDKLRKYNKQLIEKYDALTKSFFLDMFDNKSFEKYKFVDIADKSTKGTFSNGPFGSDLLTSELVDSGVPVIYIRDIAKGTYLRKSTVFVTSEKAKYLSNCHIISDDILITKVGTPPGTAAIYPKGLPMGVITQDVIRIRVNKSIVKPKFLQYWFNSHLGYNTLASIMVEGTRMRFGLGDLKKTEIGLPSINLQNQFEERIQMIESQKQQAKDALEKSEELFQSLLQKAFKDELN